MRSIPPRRGICWWDQESVLLYSSKCEGLPTGTSLVRDSKAALCPRYQGVVLQSQAQFEDSH